jgi:hypothetical protein
LTLTCLFSIPITPIDSISSIALAWRGGYGLEVLKPHFLKVEEWGVAFCKKRGKMRNLLRTGRIVIWIIIALVAAAFLLKKFIQLYK